MKTFTGYETNDGVIHRSYKDAKSHAEKRYGLQLSKMAHELVQIDKYSVMLDKLDGYKGSMRRLLDLAEDLIVEKEED